MRAALWVLALALITPLAARADDYGPKRDIAAIRHDLPTLVGSSFTDLAIDSVVVSNGEALAEWHAKNPYNNNNQHYNQYALEVLHYRLNRWWVDRSISIELGGTAACCVRAGSWMYYAPTPAFLRTFGLSDATIDLATRNVPLVVAALRVHPLCADLETPRCIYVGHADFMLAPNWVYLSNTERWRILAEPYRLTVTLGPNDAPVDAEIVGFHGRAPTEAESWANPPSGNAYFFFSGTVQSAQPVHVQAGTTFDVWFPFVLDPSLRYSLTLAAPNAMSLGPVEGTLKDNTLHFVLPAFTAPPGAELMGEIDND